MRNVHRSKCRPIATAVAAVAATFISTLAHATDPASLPTPRAEGWLVKSYGQIAAPAAPKNLQAEVTALKAIVAKRSAGDVARYRWWATGGPVYRWNEVMLDEMQEAFVTLPLAGRHLALYHAALDDAVSTARHHNKSKTRGEAVAIDAALKTSDASVSVSEYAAAYSDATDASGDFSATSTATVSPRTFDLL